MTSSAFFFRLGRLVGEQTEEVPAGTKHGRNKHLWVLQSNLAENSQQVPKLLPGLRYGEALEEHLITILYCLRWARARSIQGRQESSGGGGASLVCSVEHGDALYLDQLVATCKLSGCFARSCCEEGSAW